MSKIWKAFEIVLVPKKEAHPTCNNDCKPVTLTSIIMRTLQYIVTKTLVEQARDCMDALQFTYLENRCVEDAIMPVIDYVLFVLMQRTKQTNIPRKSFC